MKKSLLLNPKNYQAIILLGDIESENGSLKKALKLYDKAIRLKPNDPDAYDSKANTLLGEGNAKRAIPVARKALELVGKRKLKSTQLELIYDTLISSLFEAGKCNEAFSLLKKAYKKTHFSLLKSLYKWYEKQIETIPEKVEMVK